MNGAREPAVAGRFYPGNGPALRAEVARCLGAEPARVAPVLAIVAPHAGYMYSGRVAGETYAAVPPPERVVVLGPNHTGRGVQRALSPAASWTLPGGAVRADVALGERLARAASLELDAEAHRFEHSIEVQLPFLRALNADVQVSCVCLRRLSFADCRHLGEALAGVVRDGDPRALLVASSDLSHYLDAASAKVVDDRVIARMLSLDAEGLHRVVCDEDISMCGYVPVTVAMVAALELGATRARLVRYANSGDVSGDFERVVGYAGVVFS